MTRKLKTNKLQTCFSGTKLGSKFKIKDNIAKDHKHGVIYEVNCQSKRCNANYVGETSRSILVRAEEHAGKDINSHMYQHTIKPVTIKDCSTSYSNESLFYNRKIRESLFIKSIKPSLNVQGKSAPFKLF